MAWGILAAPFELPEPDVALLADPTFEKVLISTAAEAFRQGVRGYAQDVYVQGRPWPFDPSCISVPMEVVHGELDTLVPIAHRRHTAELIRSATCRTLPGHGHSTILAGFPMIASTLMRLEG